MGLRYGPDSYGRQERSDRLERGADAVRHERDKPLRRIAHPEQMRGAAHEQGIARYFEEIYVS